MPILDFYYLVDIEPEPAIYADADGFVEPKPLHRKRRIEELCRGIGSRGYSDEWADELFDLLAEELE